MRTILYNILFTMFTQTRLSYLFYTFYNGARLSITLLYKYTPVFKIFWQRKKRKKINRVRSLGRYNLFAAGFTIDMHSLASEKIERILFVVPC